MGEIMNMVERHCNSINMVNTQKNTHHHLFLASKEYLKKKDILGFLHGNHEWLIFSLDSAKQEK
jgi:hypothetical protein